jgi:hypothetical protein
MMRGDVLTVLFSAGMLVSAALPVRAQQWSAEVQAGRIRSSLDPGAAADQTLALGLRLDDGERSLSLSVGIPTSATDGVWGALSGAQRFAWSRAGFVAGIDLAGSAYLMHQRAGQREVPGPIGPPQIIAEPAYTGTAFAGQVLPLVGYEAARWQLHVRAGASLYKTEFAELERERRVMVSDAQLTITPSAGLALLPVVRRISSDGVHYTYAGASAIVANQLGSVWASAGFWPALDTVGTSWAAGANWDMHPRATLSLSGRRDSFDALYLNPPQTSWSIGLAVKLGRPAALRPPVPASYADGRAIIRLDNSHAASRPMIAGDFTNWKPRPMQQAADGWTYSAQLAPGVYNYAFVDANGKWFVPDDHPGRKPDGMGGVVAVLVVRP